MLSLPAVSIICTCVPSIAEDQLLKQYVQFVFYNKEKLNKPLSENYIKLCTNQSDDYEPLSLDMPSLSSGYTSFSGAIHNAAHTVSKYYDWITVN